MGRPDPDPGRAAEQRAAEDAIAALRERCRAAQAEHQPDPAVPQTHTRPAR